MFKFDKDLNGYFDHILTIEKGSNKKIVLDPEKGLLIDGAPVTPGGSKDLPEWVKPDGPTWNSTIFDSSQAANSIKVSEIFSAVTSGNGNDTSIDADDRILLYDVTKGTSSHITPGDFFFELIEKYNALPYLQSRSILFDVGNTTPDNGSIMELQSRGLLSPQLEMTVLDHHSQRRRWDR